MKRIAIVTMMMLLLASLLLVGCSTLKQLVPLLNTHHTYDHEVVYNTHYIHDTTYLEVSERTINDTIIKNIYHYKEHFNLLHDTITIESVKVDSIPYPVPFEVIKREEYTPWYIRLLSYLGLIPLCYLGFKGVKFVRRFV